MYIYIHIYTYMVVVEIWEYMFILIYRDMSMSDVFFEHSENNNTTETCCLVSAMLRLCGPFLMQAKRRESIIIKSDGNPKASAKLDAIQSKCTLFLLSPFRWAVSAFVWTNVIPTLKAKHSVLICRLWDRAHALCFERRVSQTPVWNHYTSFKTVKTRKWDHVVWQLNN